MQQIADRFVAWGIRHPNGLKLLWFAVLILMFLVFWGLFSLTAAITAALVVVVPMIALILIKGRRASR